MSGLCHARIVLHDLAIECHDLSNTEVGDKERTYQIHVHAFGSILIKQLTVLLRHVEITPDILSIFSSELEDATVVSINSTRMDANNNILLIVPTLRCASYLTCAA